MPLARTDQYAAMLDAAAASGYAYPAVNVTSSETLNAALRGFAEAESDGIVQITVGAAAFLSGASVGDALLGATAFARLASTLAEASPVLVALHTDHCPPARVDDLLRPLVAESAARMCHGAAPLFHSHMFDGSSLPLADNLAIAGRLLAECSAIEVVLEVECGVVGGEEDGLGGSGAGRPELYTTPADLLRVAEVLGTGERGRYLLAATFGNVHGTYPPGAVVLRPEILRAGQESLGRVHPGARFDFVFHGSSGSSAAELAEAVGYGVVKVNIDTDTQFAFTRAVAGHMFENTHGLRHGDGGGHDKRTHDPRVWAARGETAMAERVRHACEQLGSARRSLIRRRSTRPLEGARRPADPGGVR